VDIEFGQRYERSQSESPEQFIGALADFCKGRLHGLVLRMELATGDSVTGIVDQVDPRNGVILERGDETLIGSFRSAEIAAFSLPPESIDHSDELRGI